MKPIRRVMRETRRKLYDLASTALMRKHPDVLYVVENADWSVRWDGFYISRGVSARGINCVIGKSNEIRSARLIHFGCLSLCLKGAARAFQEDRLIIATLFHGNFGINPELDGKLNQFLQLVPCLARVVVANQIMFERLVSWGVPESKLVLIPLGVDLDQFHPVAPDQKRELRDRYGIPNSATCIGSFHKDGEGWGDGKQPKFIKGPDVFVDVVEKLSNRFPVHCLLTGPSRGYVKDALYARGIPFTHHFFENYWDIADFYHCLDLYLITSREDGGPKALLEAPACGIPVVSSRVGMAPEVIGEHGLLAVGTQELVDASTRILGDTSFGNLLADAAPNSIQEYDWNIISDRYHALYQELLR